MQWVFALWKTQIHSSRVKDLVNKIATKINDNCKSCEQLKQNAMQNKTFSKLHLLFVTCYFLLAWGPFWNLCVSNAFLVQYSITQSIISFQTTMRQSMVNFQITIRMMVPWLDVEEENKGTEPEGAPNIETIPKQRSSQLCKITSI